MSTARERYLLERCLRLEALLLRAAPGANRFVTVAEVSTMQEMRDRGMLLSEIAAQMGWSEATVARHTVAQWTPPLRSRRA